MDNTKIYEEYIESTYEELKRLSENDELGTYLARNRQTGALVVKKQVSVEVGDVYKKLQRINTPNLVPILDICRLEDSCIVVESYISGETLEQRLDRTGKFAKDEALYYGIQILRCLQILHKNGIVHRDLTPANILISIDGIVKIIDFGIARTQKENQTKDTVIMGTVGYASPEQFGFQQTDARTDIYAFGVLFNKMLTGYMPNEQLPEIRTYRKIIEKCTMMDPQKRYVSAGEILKKLGKKPGENIWETDCCIWPGFRRNIIWHKVIAIVVYIYCLIGFLGIWLGNFASVKSVVTNFVAMCLFWVAPILIITNFGRWENRLKYYAKIPLVLRIVIRIILVFGFLVSGVLLADI